MHGLLPSQLRGEGEEGRFEVKGTCGMEMGGNHYRSHASRPLSIQTLPLGPRPPNTHPQRRLLKPTGNRGVRPSSQKGPKGGAGGQPSGLRRLEGEAEGRSEGGEMRRDGVPISLGQGEALPRFFTAAPPERGRRWGGGGVPLAP